MFQAKYIILIHCFLICTLVISCDSKEVAPTPPSSSNESATLLDQTLGDSIVFDWAERSFSPMYSNIGVVFSEYPGLLGIYFHYNYKNRALTHLIEIPDSIQSTQSSILGVTQTFSKGEMNYAFYDQNTLLIEIKGYDQVPFWFKPPTKIPILSRKDKYEYTYQPWVEEKANYFLFKGFMNNRDARDPDPFYPITLGLNVLEGQASDIDKGGMEIKQDGERILLAISLQAGDLSEEKLAQKLAGAPTEIAEARKRTAAWLQTAVGDLPLEKGSPKERQIAAKAALALTFNACEGTGYHAGKVATFPNRGNYATQFEWDAAFQNLAYEMMDERLAEDALLIMTESQRPDGKMGQFVTATYLRPVETQVPLIGWAAERMYRQRDNKAFIEKVLPKLVKNTEWILQNRMTRYGLTSAISPWELWDDTPRLDDGPILACDFNADLLLQIRACAFFAEELGNKAIADKCKRLGDDLAKRMMEILYDEEDNIFRDVLVENGQPLSILTPANFVPLLTDIPIAEEKAKAMIQTYLLDENKFFGSVPFPSVAYDEPTYVPHKPGKPNALTWRGPTWMPMAWMMMEVLKKYDFEEEYWYAMNRIYQLMLEDGELHELFNSQSGEGIGIPQLGWTAAIFLKIKGELEKNDKKNIQ